MSESNFQIVSTTKHRSIAGIAIIVLLGLAAIMAKQGMNKLSEMRQLERVPHTDVVAITGGEVNLSGVAQPKSDTLRSPRTHTETLYYRYVVEKKESDSDGKTKWRTLTDKVESVPFVLDDGTGQITVIPNARVTVDATMDFQETRGDRRYTEYRIEPGSRLFVFATALGSAGQYELHFDQPGHYTPIISQNSESQMRSRMAASSLRSTWGALAFTSAAILLVCLVFGIHQTALFLSILSTVAFLGLLNWGWQGAKMDLQSASERHDGVIQRAQNEIAASLRQHNILWDGDWAELGSLDESTYPSLPVAERDRLNRIRMDAARSAQRVRETWQRTPERFIAWSQGTSAPAPIPLPAQEGALLASLEAGYSPTRLSGSATTLTQLGGLALALPFTWYGFRRIRIKRLIENMPTSLSSGVAYGMSELSGEVVLAPGSSPLLSPSMERECVYYRYVVKEKQGSGKNSSWKTIEDRSDGCRFVLRDREGDFPIDPTGAEVISQRTSLSRRGNRRYTEYRIDIGDQLYALGRASIDPETHASLYMAAGEEPFILSNMSENDVMLRKASAGFGLLTLSFLALLASALATIGAVGSLSGLSYMLAALTGPLFLSLVLVALMYNDLVFLHQRVAMTWSNIGISLKKRAELLPNLQEVVKGYLAHESELQTSLAALRQQAGHASEMSSQEAASFIEQERGLLDRVRLLVEKYPELKASEMMQGFQQSLVMLENEIALMRDGFNHAVERYNTRRGQLPEVLLAKLFRFEVVSPFKAEAEVQTVPQLKLGDAMPVMENT